MNNFWARAKQLHALENGMEWTREMGMNVKRSWSCRLIKTFYFSYRINLTYCCKLQKQNVNVKQLGLGLVSINIIVFKI